MCLKRKKWSVIIQFQQCKSGTDQQKIIKIFAPVHWSPKYVSTVYYNLYVLFTCVDFI